MQKKLNLQDAFLNAARRSEVPVTVFLVNGFQMRGTITGYDAFTVVLTAEGRQNLIYKHAISTVSPARALELAAWREEDGPAEERSA